MFDWGIGMFVLFIGDKQHNDDQWPIFFPSIYRASISVLLERKTTAKCSQIGNNVLNSETDKRLDDDDDEQLMKWKKKIDILMKNQSKE